MFGIHFGFLMVDQRQCQARLILNVGRYFMPIEVVMQPIIVKENHEIKHISKVLKLC